MRDIFADIFETRPPEPREAARRSLGHPQRKRFYEQAEIHADGAQFSVLLDGKPVRTPARGALAAPVRVLAEAMAAEWNAQGEAIDPATMPMTRLANAVIDAVTDHAASVRDEIIQYLGSDLVCYRAEGPEGLVTRQTQAWDPIIAFARDSIGARFVLAQGVVHVKQPAEAVAAAAKTIPDEPWRLGALSLATTLTGSALIAMALAAGEITAEQAWAAAHVDEDWQMSQWGSDAETQTRRVSRFGDLQAAAVVLAEMRPR